MENVSLTDFQKNKDGLTVLHKNWSIGLMDFIPENTLSVQIHQQSYTSEYVIVI